MEKIPQEIYDQIAAYLEDAKEYPGQFMPRAERSFDRPALAIVSQKWQYTIEKVIFQELNLSNMELDEFEAIMTGARRQYLRVLRYRIVLPTYPTASRMLFERHEDRAINDEAFSTAMHNLFQIFKSWEDQSSDWPGYSIQLNIYTLYSPTDYRFPGRSYVPTEEEEKCQYGEFGMRYRYSYIRLLNATELPSVSGIQAFGYYQRSMYCCKLAPQSLIEIVAKLPNMSKIWLDLADTEFRYRALRRQYRDGLANAIDSLLFPASTEYLNLNLLHIAPLNQSWQLADLLQPDDNHDPLSSAIWRATSHQNRLTTLCINGVVDASLLGLRALEQPFWQNLKSLAIRFNMTTPSGDWYFCSPRSEIGNDSLHLPTRKAELEREMPPGYNRSEQEGNLAISRFAHVHELELSGHDDTRAFRLSPNESVLVPLIEAFARACSQIPSLEKATLVADHRRIVRINSETYNFGLEWGIYVLAHTPIYSLRKWAGPYEDLAVARLTFNTGNWRPDEGLLKILRGIGGYRESLHEKYIDLWETFLHPEETERMMKWLARYGNSQNQD
ncbi:hypothetical protein F5884DRAFT_725922 [Xylogone sp. PMI_703]|nr:hypothetical protein F5884DRAFT_725922 [Xylogone sp. PMI_703]